jgi:hypothetical protein
MSENRTTGAQGSVGDKETQGQGVGQKDGPASNWPQQSASDTGGGAYAQERGQADTGAATAQAPAQGGGMDARTAAVARLGAEFSLLVNKQIEAFNATSTLKVPHQSREWKVVAYDPIDGLQLQEPLRPQNVAYVEFDEAMMKAILPKIFTI